MREGVNIYMCVCVKSRVPQNIPRIFDYLWIYWNVSTRLALLVRLWFVDDSGNRSGPGSYSEWYTDDSWRTSECTNVHLYERIDGIKSNFSQYVCTKYLTETCDNNTHVKIWMIETETHMESSSFHRRAIQSVSCSHAWRLTVSSKHFVY